ncbi:SoxR reducing system RseC family protein [Nitrincola sp.]|uniref:SoxR reducing system RseC family protein n=1 Tax=Nitrincola sp. TaxID=1926584 RepID=UPI003A9515EE
MLEEVAQVSEVHPDHLVIETRRLSACQSCQSHDNCGQRKLAGLFGSKPAFLKIANPEGLSTQPGQSVVIGLHEGAILKSSLLLYLMPLLVLIGASLLASWFFDRELIVILAGITGLSGGFWLARILSANLLSNPSYYPVLLRVNN